MKKILISIIVFLCINSIAISKETTFTNEMFKKSQLDGKTVVIHSWNKTCTTCAEQVKILDLAEKLIYLSGRNISDGTNNEGIQIKEVGLRPGEKLYEELLIDGKSQKTDHPLIFKAIEKSIDFDDLKEKLDSLYIHLKNNEIKKTIETLSEIIPEWLRK